MGGVKSEFANLELSPGHPEGFIFFGFLGFWEAFKIGAFSITNPYGFVTFSATWRGVGPFRTQKTQKNPEKNK